MNIKEILYTFLDDYFPCQKINYIKHLFSNKAAKLRYKPITISTVSTNRCTLSCDMCPTHSSIVPNDYKWRQSVSEDMSFDLFKKVLDGFPEALNVQIIGSGEPMLNRDFFKMVKYASRNKKMKVKTSSNGTTIKENAENILNSDLDSLTISINGHTPQEFHRMTGMGEGVFTEICNATRQLIEENRKRKSKLKIKLSFIIDKINYRALPEIINFSEGFNPDFVFLCNFLPCPHEGLTPKERVITSDDTEIVNFIRKVKKNIAANRKEKISFPLMIDNKMTENKCNVHFQQLRVDGNGNVSSCSMMLLNMNEASKIDVKDCWNSEFFVTMREKFLKDKALDELCHYCPSNKGIEI